MENYKIERYFKSLIFSWRIIEWKISTSCI